jgi:hypothetical protein
LFGVIESEGDDGHFANNGEAVDREVTLVVRGNGAAVQSVGNIAAEVEYWVNDGFTMFKVNFRMDKADYFSMLRNNMAAAENALRR